MYTIPEINRSYEIITTAGGIIYKYMRPSEMKKIYTDKEKMKKLKWNKVKMVGSNTFDRVTSAKPIIPKNISPNWMLGETDRRRRYDK